MHAEETADGWQIVGDVCERQPIDSALARHLPPAHHADSFPKATHRKMSKVYHFPKQPLSQTAST
jgi:hypothetical protein